MPQSFQPRALLLAALCPELYVAAPSSGQACSPRAWLRGRLPGSDCQASRVTCAAVHALWKGLLRHGPLRWSCAAEGTQCPCLQVQVALLGGDERHIAGHRLELLHNSLEGGREEGRLVRKGRERLEGHRELLKGIVRSRTETKNQFCLGGLNGQAERGRAGGGRDWPAREQRRAFAPPRACLYGKHRGRLAAAESKRAVARGPWVHCGLLCREWTPSQPA